MTAKGTGVIFLQRDKFYFFYPTIPKVLEFNFVPDFVSDLEVINKELLFNMLNVFTQSNNIPPCDLTIIIANNACFIKDFQKQAKIQAAPQNSVKKETNPQHVDDSETTDLILEKQIAEFIEHIPFERVVSIKFDIQNGCRVITTNQELFDALKSFFEEHNFSVDKVIPGVVFGNNIGAQPYLTSQAASYILQTVTGFKRFNFLDQQARETEKLDSDEGKDDADISDVNIQPIPGRKTDKKRLILLASVFGTLLVVMVIVYFVSNPSTDTSTTAKAQQEVSSVESINPPQQ